MKRQLTFEYENDYYVIKEDGETIFSINGKELKFISIDFYNGIYKDKLAAIELSYEIYEDDLKKGKYIFNWLSEIMEAIQDELNDPELSEIEEIKENTGVCVPLFELSACAGDGFFSDGPSSENGKIPSPYMDANYAVKISGKSMEPTITDQSIVFVKSVETLNDGDIGIFVVNENVMCKRYKETGSKKWLQPDNSSNEFSIININEDTNCIIQGKVLLDSKN